MLFAISKFIAGLFGLDITKVQKTVLVIAMVLAGLVVLLPVIFIYRACNRPPHLDEKQIQKAQQAIAKDDRKAMLEVLAESDTKEAQIDSNIKLIEKATEDAKKSYLDKSNQDLADELNRRAAQ